jgi:hypothetical protein
VELITTGWANPDIAPNSFSVPLIYLYFVVLCRTNSQLRFLCLRLNSGGFHRC